MGYRTTKSKIKEKDHKASSYTDFFYYSFRNILLILIPLLIISTLVLSLPHSSADNNTSSDSLSISISSACTLSSSIDRAHTVNVNAGTHTVDIGSTRVNAYCNDNNGYSIYAIGSSNNIDGNTDLISSNNDGYNIKTGIYDEGSSSSLTPSSWGMKLAPGIGTGLNPDTGASIAITPPTIVNNYDNYNVVPNNYTLVASRASGTNMTIDTDITGSYFATTYDVYASSVQPAGTYNGKVKYLMVHPSSNNNHLGFNEAYASQGKNPVNTESGTYYTMQDMNSYICNSVGSYDEASQTQLIDIRDNKLYWVAKLQDGHCWMTQNLGLDLVAYTNEQGQEVMKSLTSNDTDLTDHSLVGAYASRYTYDVNTGITTWTPAMSAKTMGFEGIRADDWNDSNTVPYSANKTDSTNTGHSSLGNYYNWTVAIASNDSSTLTQDTSNNVSNNPKNSICPKGWRLSTISNQSEAMVNSTNEFARLKYLYNLNVIADVLVPPLYFIKSGYIGDGASINGLDAKGLYWSSTINNNSAFDFAFTQNGIFIKDATDRRRGATLRCIAR
ncbi:hypothetical protein IJJ53_01835 [Candidatus Saccharibacteria bacterium]|nr:hypothetical protein [Candidatus Saccharibacteria bacterium]